VRKERQIQAAYALIEKFRVWETNQVLKAAQNPDRPPVEVLAQSMYHIPDTEIKDLYAMFPIPEQVSGKASKPEFPFGHIAAPGGDKSANETEEKKKNEKSSKKDEDAKKPKK
jgi:hypothetical protein